MHTDIPTMYACMHVNEHVFMYAWHGVLFPPRCRHHGTYIHTYIQTCMHTYIHTLNTTYIHTCIHNLRRKISVLTKTLQSVLRTFKNDSGHSSTMIDTMSCMRIFQVFKPDFGWKTKSGGQLQVYKRGPLRKRVLNMGLVCLSVFVIGLVSLFTWQDQDPCPMKTSTETIQVSSFPELLSHPRVAQLMCPCVMTTLSLFMSLDHVH
jgi:hypothetical protein